MSPKVIFVEKVSDDKQKNVNAFGPWKRLII